MQPETQETEIRETNTQVGDTTVQKQVVSRRPQTSSAVVLQRIIWFIVGFVSTVVAIRFVLLLLGANEEAAFTSFVYALSGPFVAPFVGILGEPTYGQSVFELSSVLAIAVYSLIGWGVARLITIARPQDEI